MPSCVGHSFFCLLSLHYNKQATCSYSVRQTSKRFIMQNRLFFASLFVCFHVFSQSNTQKILFLGNSYTAVNNLPQMLKDAALSVGDSVIFDANVPGGNTLLGHSSNQTSLNKIMLGNWNYVVLQEQSQFPSFPIQQVESDVFPYARKLDSIILQYNPCAETVFYMTWGRKNGDATNCGSWPPVCTYSGMDSLLNLRYRAMAQQNDAILSPVGEVWNYVRTNHPEIELYQSDESHPSVAGTYLAACTFYASIFRKDPTLITFYASLSAEEAIKIQNAVKFKVFDSLLTWNIGLFDVNAAFSYEINVNNEVGFFDNSTVSDSLRWDFGDGDFSNELNPSHIYGVPGVYNVVLTVYSCGKWDTITKQVNITAASVGEEMFVQWHIFPNPAGKVLNITSILENSSNYAVYNTVGELVLSGEFISGNNQISLENLKDGVYQIELFDASKSLGRSKLIKIMD